jgi:hypothetical protein
MQPNVSICSLANQEAAGFKFMTIVAVDGKYGLKGDVYRYHRSFAAALKLAKGKPMEIVSMGEAIGYLRPQVF